MLFRLTIASIFIACSALAQGTASCADIEQDEKRLACFDKLGRSAEAEATAGWTSKTEIDPITETVRVYTSIAAENPTSCGFGRDRPKLELLCANDTWFVRIHQTCTLSGTADQFTLDSRVDDLPPSKDKFAMAEQRNHLQMSVAQAASLIRRLVDADRYLLRLQPAFEYSEVIEFRVGGLTSALQKSGANCAM